LRFSGASFDALPFKVIHFPLLTITNTGAVSRITPIGFTLMCSQCRRTKEIAKTTSAGVTSEIDEIDESIHVWNDGGEQ
jgi:hypothetical protein